MAPSAYIVAFKKPAEGTSLTDLVEPWTTKVEKSGGSIKHTYTSKVMLGFAGTFDDDLKKELEAHPDVKYVEPDGPVGTK